MTRLNSESRSEPGNGSSAARKWDSESGSGAWPGLTCGLSRRPVEQVMSDSEWDSARGAGSTRAQALQPGSGRSTTFDLHHDIREPVTSESASRRRLVLPAQQNETYASAKRDRRTPPPRPPADGPNRARASFTPPPPPARRRRGRAGTGPPPLLTQPLAPSPAPRRRRAASGRLRCVSGPTA